MKRKIRPKLLSTLLALALCFTMMPTAAFAKMPEGYVPHTPKHYTICASHEDGAGKTAGKGEYTWDELKEGYCWCTLSG